MNAQSLLSFNKQVDDQNVDSLLKQFAETLSQHSITLDETEKSADEKVDGRVLIRGSSPTHRQSGSGGNLKLMKKRKHFLPH